MNMKTLMLAATGGMVLALLVGNTFAQQNREDGERRQGQGERTEKTEEQRRAEAEAAEKRRAERRANRTGDEREKEEDEGRPQEET
ncbi:MAG: hypothetical protein Q4B94_08430 [Pseudomonadota bacterium]|nr:hypothetical protein [Pseudomonadota bacterium]